MKDKALEMISNLDNFLDNLTSLVEHPYSAGVNINKVLVDTKNFIKDLREAIEHIEEKEETHDENE